MTRPLLACSSHAGTSLQSNSRDHHSKFQGAPLTGNKRPFTPRNSHRRTLNVVIITVFSSDGTITTIPAIPQHLDELGKTSDLSSNIISLPTPQDQGLCIGSIFSISATNGVDVTRRMNVLGFCQSVEMLHESVERKVAQRGGEIFKVQRELKSGVHETLTMTLALPLLWGVPPEHERLTSGIESGGGIIDRIYQEWFIGTLN